MGIAGQQARDARVRYWVLRLQQAHRVRLIEDALGLPAVLPIPAHRKQHRVLALVVAASLGLGLGIPAGMHFAPDNDKAAVPTLLAPVAAAHIRRRAGYNLPPSRRNASSMRANLASIPSLV